MKKLNYKEFVERFKQPVVFFVNPSKQIAFKVDTKNSKVFCKGHGCKETQISLNDVDYLQGMLFNTILTAKEYDNY